MSGFNLGETQKQSEQAEEHLHDASTRLANLHKIKPVGLEGFEKELYRCLGSLVAAVGSSNTVMRQMYLLRTPTSSQGFSSHWGARALWDATATEQSNHQAEEAILDYIFGLMEGEAEVIDPRYANKSFKVTPSEVVENEDGSFTLVTEPVNGNDEYFKITCALKGREEG